MKTIRDACLAWTAMQCLWTRMIKADISPLHRSKDYSEGKLGKWPHQLYQSSPAIGPLLNIQEDHPTCHENDDHLIMMAPWGSEVTNPGPMILDAWGNLIWNEPTKYGKTWAMDVRMFEGKPYLTFWASKDPASEVGHWYMLNSTYDEVFQIRPSEGWTSDDHDFEITPKGTAILVVNKDIPFDLSPVGGPRHGWLRENGIQEIDIRTGELLFHWGVSSHYKLEEGYHGFTPGWGEDPDHPFEPFVLNSAYADPHGNYLVSIRHMSSVAYINGRTGEVTWKLGGKKNAFSDLSPKPSRGATVFNGQHHARILEPQGTQTNKAMTITIFDNGFGAQEIAHATSGKIIELDLDEMTAQLLHEPYQNERQPISTQSRGSLQVLPNGNRLLGYGTVAAWAEFAPDGRLLCDVHFAPEAGFNTQEAFSYRVLRRQWVGEPRQRPSAVVDETDRLYVSWNGATEVTSWELQARHSRSDDEDEDDSYVSLGNLQKTGFETMIHLPRSRDNQYFRVVARNSQGSVLGFSEDVDRYGSNASQEHDSRYRADLR